MKNIRPWHFIVAIFTAAYLPTALVMLHAGCPWWVILLPVLTVLGAILAAVFVFLLVLVLTALLDALLQDAEEIHDGSSSDSIGPSANRPPPTAN